ncbi:GNAT family N-acetyltransferase [Marinimicrobium sp. ABcell2]|uniref:GNAT family N-acetyltransferase n=1 Tax=Marinimicrobium sp. ABcell2 TaxID=3069751 RepID=UPI0027B2D13E|nr:GNAT family N-acetyltransferase [Marinimicrobium sp. ABcell2]MDQ2076773.1 GNAT family N-acetyltransferase [Marinimicrobium sp. ABcell2]
MINIETVEVVPEEDLTRLMHWREQVFPVEGRGMEWAQSTWHSVAYDAGGQAIGHIGFGAFTLFEDSVERAVIGVGGVVVRPEHQSEGIPAQLFAEVHQQAEQRLGSDIFTLFCPLRLVPYYTRHGYGHHSGPVQFIQKGELVTSNFEFMHRDGLSLDSAIELKGNPW